MPKAVLTNTLLITAFHFLILCMEIVAIVNSDNYCTIYKDLDFWPKTTGTPNISAGILFPSLCSELKRKHFIIVLGLSRLVGSKDRWHHNNSSPSHLSPSSLTRNDSSPLSYDPLTPIRAWQGVPLLTAVQTDVKDPIPSELQLFLRKASTSESARKEVWQ